MGEGVNMIHFVVSLNVLRLISKNMIIKYVAIRIIYVQWMSSIKSRMPKVRE